MPRVRRVAPILAGAFLRHPTEEVVDPLAPLKVEDNLVDPELLALLPARNLFRVDPEIGGQGLQFLDTKGVGEFLTQLDPRLTIGWLCAGAHPPLLQSLLVGPTR